MTETETKPVVVVGVDGSQSSKEALRWAAKYAELIGAEVRAVISYETEFYIGGSPNAGHAEQARKAGEEAVSDVLGAKPSVPVAFDVIAGHAGQALVEASRSADLLVVGRRGHGAFVSAFLGSVSNHCVRHARCPVLVHHHGNDHD